MATKRAECCPMCATSSVPTDWPVALNDDYGMYPAKLWRYVCQACGWVWANEAQRKHNETAYRQARRAARARIYS